jgi:hypothetical protein
MKRIRNLEDLLEIAAVNPRIAENLKSDSRRVGELLGVDLTDDEAQLIERNLDMDLVLQAAEAVDSMAQKVAQGIGLETFRRDDQDLNLPPQ